MDIYFKQESLDPSAIPEATNYRIWSEELKKHLRIYKYKDKSYVKVPGSHWYKIIEKKKYKCENFETEIYLALPISKDE